MSDKIVIRSAEEVVAALGDLLEDASLPDVAFALHPSAGRNAKLGIRFEGKQFRWEIKARLSITRRDLDQLKLSSDQILVVVQLTDAQVKLCAERGISAVGLNGRIWIRKPGMIIDARLPKLGRNCCTPEPDVRVFSPRSTRLARALLSSRQPCWTVSQLSQVTKLSLSRISNLLNACKDNGWVDGSRGDWRLVDADAFLDAWAREDAWSERGSLKQYASIHPNPEAVAAALIKHTSDPMAFTQWYAANLRYPYTTTPICSVYRKLHLTGQEVDAAGLREVTTGGKLWVVVPRDEGVFQFVQKAGGVSLVSDVQIYLDLLQVGLRGPDQAKALRSWSEFRK